MEPKTPSKNTNALPISLLRSHDAWEIHKKEIDQEIYFGTKPPRQPSPHPRVTRFALGRVAVRARSQQNARRASHSAPVRAHMQRFVVQHRPPAPSSVGRRPRPARFSLAARPGHHFGTRLAGRSLGPPHRQAEQFLATTIVPQPSPRPSCRVHVVCQIMGPLS